MLKLYYAPQTRSHRPRWLLEELGVPHELVRMNPGDATPEYVASVHPLGAVPALDDDGLVLFESGAICAYLADRFEAKGLAPAPGTRERGEYYKWLFFAAVTLDRSIITCVVHTVMLPEEERSKELAEKSRADFVEDQAPALERALADGREFLLGAQFTAADVMVGSLVGIARLLGMLEGFPKLEAYAKRVSSRPANKRARAD